MAWAGIVGAPLIWLTALQAGYVLAYQACDSGSRSWVTVPTAVATAMVIAACGVAATSQTRSRRAIAPMPLLARVGVGVAATMVTVMIASLIAPMLLQPCD